MGVLENIGVPEGFFGNFFSGQSLLMWFGIIFLCFVILVFVGGITFFFTMRKSKRISFKNQIPIFMNINGKHTRIGIDQAKELFIPDSNISLFFLKSHKTYLARPTRAMGKNEYWYSISENGEWVNFNLSENPEDNTLADTNYDHRDTRYAYVNLKEIIKKNYKDKAIVWWKDPVVMNIIAFVIMSIIFVGAIWFLMIKMGHLISEVSGLISKLEPLVKTATSAEVTGSGVVQVT